MQVTINGETALLAEEKITVAGLLALRQVESPEMVSVQVNGRIIDRQRYADEVVHEGDEVDFLYFMGGGGGRAR